MNGRVIEKGDKNGGNKGLSILAGIILGFVIGIWIYVIASIVFVSGPILVPQEFEKALLARVFNALKFGAAPGTFVGFIAGLVIPFHLPRGHMAKSIGAFCWIPITALAWITNWKNLYAMRAGRIVLAVVTTFFSLLVILPVSGALGHIIERIRKR